MFSLKNKMTARGEYSAVTTNYKSGTVKRAWANSLADVSQTHRVNRKTELVGGPIRNLVLDSYFNQLGTGSINRGSYVYGEMELGSGTAERDKTMTELNNPGVKAWQYLNGMSVGKTTITDTDDTPIGVELHAIVAAIFPPGIATGIWTEVGTYAHGVLIASSLIKDSEGNPASITVLADEELRLYHRISRSHSVIDTPVPFNFNLNGEVKTGSYSRPFELLNSSSMRMDDGFNQYPSNVMWSPDLFPNPLSGYFNSYNLAPYADGSYRVGWYGERSQGLADASLYGLRTWDGTQILFDEPIAQTSNQVGRFGSSEEPFFFNDWSASVT